MYKSTSLRDLAAALSQQARRLGLTDTAWAARAGVRKETLSRLRHRETCDFATLAALARAVGREIGLGVTPDPDRTADGHFPAAVNRDYEERLADLGASGDLNVKRWFELGPPFFMAGLAVMLAGVRGYDRPGLLALAEQLHPGASEVAVFERWLARSPVRPTRFLPLVKARERALRWRHAG